ncbi:MAG: beta-phosphoglucomutase family hydrolase [Acidimicrobiia bacterium]|nr:beta-phosphoglucomutase family hydrolase [Acidimicrobiia bacterium]
MSEPDLTPHDVSWPSYDAVLFDLDGVITPTADVHERAWRTMFDEFLARHVGDGYTPCSEQDYLAYIDGRPRFDGVRTFLQARDIDLPEGTAQDAPGYDTVGALGNRKNELFLTVLRRDGISAYPGAQRLLDHLATLGTATAVVSSSRNAVEVLRAAGLLERLPTVVDGVVARDRDLPGKPAPDMFLAACEMLGAAPSSAVVLEDALSGVAAGRAGAFALVVGVDRGAGTDALREAGADLVVGDLGELVPDGGSS